MNGISGFSHGVGSEYRGAGRVGGASDREEEEEGKKSSMLRPREEDSVSISERARELMEQAMEAREEEDESSDEGWCVLEMEREDPNDPNSAMLPPRVVAEGEGKMPGVHS